MLADPVSGLTHSALVRKRKHSGKHAERLLSYYATGSTKTRNPESGNGNGITETETETDTESVKEGSKRSI